VPIEKKQKVRVHKGGAPRKDYQMHHWESKALEGENRGEVKQKTYIMYLSYKDQLRKCGKRKGECEKKS